MRVSIPAVLAVAAIGAAAGCPADDGGPTTTAATSTSTTTSTSTSTSTSSGTGTGTGAGTGTGTGTGTESSSGSTGIDLPDCAAIEDEIMCSVQGLCEYIMGLGCRPDCELIPDRYSCVQSDFCYWFEDTCNTPI